MTQMKNTLETQKVVLISIPSNFIAIGPKINKILIDKHGNNEKLHKASIYKFIDRYSFGLMLLSVLKKYFEVSAQVDETFVSKLLEIIKKCCLIKYGLIATTDDVKNDYLKFTDELLSPPVLPDEKTKQPPVNRTTKYLPKWFKWRAKK